MRLLAHVEAHMRHCSLQWLICASALMEWCSVLGCEWRWRTCAFSVRHGTSVWGGMQAHWLDWHSLLRVGMMAQRLPEAGGCCRVPSLPFVVGDPCRRGGGVQSSLVHTRTWPEKPSDTLKSEKKGGCLGGNGVRAPHQFAQPNASAKGVRWCQVGAVGRQPTPQTLTFGEHADEAQVRH